MAFVEIFNGREAETKNRMKNIKLIVLIVAFGLLIQAQTSFAQSDCSAADTHFTNGKNLVEQGKFKEAQAELSIYVGCNPQKFDGYSQRARAEVLANDLDPAMADANKALALNPQDANAFNVRGLVNKNKKNFEAAVRDFTDAIRLEPANPKAFFNRSNSYVELKDVEKATLDINKAIDLAPTISRSYVQRGLINFSAQNWADAEKDFSQAIKLGENTAFIYMNRGAANHNLAKYAQAVADDRKALELDPNNATAKTNLELSLAEQKQPDKQGTNGSLDLNAIDGMILQGEYDAALKILDDIIRADPNNAAAYTERAFCYNYQAAFPYNRSYYLQATADADKAISIDKNYAEAWLVRGISKNYTLGIKEAQIDFDESDRLVTAALVQNPKHARNHFIKGMLFDMKRRSESIPAIAASEYNMAGDEYAKAIEFDPKFTMAHLEHGQHVAFKYSDGHNAEAALKDFNKVIEFCPKAFDGYIERGKNYMNLGEFEKAHSDFYQAITLRPNDENGQFWVKNYINTDDERILQYNYFNRLFSDASRAFDSEIVRHAGVKKTQPGKVVICQSLAKFYAAFQNEREAFGKITFINQYPDLNPRFEKIVVYPKDVNNTELSDAQLNSVKFAIYFNKTHTETMAKNLEIFKNDNRQNQCNLDIQ